LLDAGATGLLIEWTAPPVQLLPQGDGTVEVVAAGYPQTDQPGAPCLPFAAVLIALPPGASPQLRILAIQEETLPLPAPLAAAPRPAGALRDRDGRPSGAAFAPAAALRLGEKTASPRAGSQPAPSAPVILEEIGVASGVRLARLTFYPALPDERFTPPHPFDSAEKLPRSGQAPGPARAGQLRLVRQLRVEVRWAAGTAARTDPAAPPDPLLEALRRQVLNPWDVVPGERPAVAARPVAAAPPTAMIEVAAAGLYRVAYADLSGLGFAAADPQKLRLLQGGDEVAYEWEGDADALFEPGEALLFYADPRPSRWTGVDVYRLTVESASGARMGTRSADPTGLSPGVPRVEQQVEQNTIYTPDCFCGLLPAGRDGDHWAWELLRRPDQANLSFPFQAPAADVARPAELTLWLIGYTDVAADPDHRLDAALNGVSLGRVEWDGRAAVTATLPIPAGVLHSGANTLTLDLPGIPGVFVEGAWLDGFAVRYGRSAAPLGAAALFGLPAPGASAPLTPTLPHRLYLPLALRGFDPQAAQAYTVTLASPGPYRAYDVTDPRHPVRLTGVRVSGNGVAVADPPGDDRRRYLVVADAGILRPSSQRAARDPFGLDGGGEPTGADYLVITHPDFAAALGPLVDLRRSQGLTVAVADVLGIYDRWGDGRPDPQAIRALIAHAYETWVPRPAYVLLVGDGSFDPRRYWSASPPTLIPPYLVDVDPWAGEAAADNRYVCVDGADTLPDLAIGRLPAQTAAEAAAIVTKIVGYETAPYPGDWNANVLLIADDADSSGNFAASSEGHAALYVTPPFTATRRYCAGVSPTLSDCPSGAASGIHTALLDDWARGALLIQYTGHSSWQQWAAERFLHLDDLAGLGDERRLPVVLEMTCFTASFHRPEPVLDEELVVLAGGGAAAVWGPTGLGVGAGHEPLSEGFFQAVLSTGVERLGEAILAGKLELAAGDQSLDLLDTYTLLGDPALRLHRIVAPWAVRIFLPLLRK
jgi:hypothetical protein